MKNRFILYLLVLFLFLLITGCNDDDDGVQPPKLVKLVEASELFQWSKGEIDLIVTAAGFGELKEYLQHDVRIFEITYKTNYLGDEIIASGVVGLPDTEQAVPMLSFQHGTIVKHSDAPSENGSNYRPLAAFASTGYIFLIPDFIGFGSSKELFHPYYRKDLTASSVIDMLIAAGELAALEGYHFNEKVFLAGYSEGGYATMVSHQALEEDPIEGFDLIASAPASGGYDVKGMREYFFNLDTYSEPYYLPYVTLSYNITYDWDQPLSDFFQEPYASQIPNLFDGSLSGSEINSQLTTRISDLLAPSFISGIETDPNYEGVRNALNENSILAWVPQSSVFMYHGTEDTTVPYQNSVSTYEGMLAAGASPEVVKLIPLHGEDHGSGFEPYLLDLVARFEALR